MVKAIRINVNKMVTDKVEVKVKCVGVNKFKIKTRIAMFVLKLAFFILKPKSVEIDFKDQG